MSEDTAVAHNAFAPSPFGATLPAGMLMWASMYTVMFYICGGMIAAMYDPD
jgi:hypothetical protein